MSFPVKQGDTGWLVANDRNISIFKQNLEESAPNDYRKHNFLDAFILPDKINDINYSQADDGALVIQTLSGNTKITLKEGLITLNSASVVINGDTTINGSLVVSTETTTNGIPFTTHVHGGVYSGSSNTGVPQ